jgi:DNA-binding beta-propeller fold protein YncE/plastocyanin
LRKAYGDALDRFVPLGPFEPSARRCGSGFRAVSARPARQWQVVVRGLQTSTAHAEGDRWPPPTPALEVRLRSCLHGDSRQMKSNTLGPRRKFVIRAALLLAAFASISHGPASLRASAPGTARAAGGGGAKDVFNLTDEPGNWFRSEATGKPVTLVDAGDRVDFKINGCCTNTRHTATLIVKPVGSRTELDQDESKNGTLSAEFDLPGVYILHCKVHPYMTAVVAVRNAAGNIPDVTAASLPFIGHLGVPSLPAATVLSVVTTIAPKDADKKAKWEIFPRGAGIVPPVPGVGEVWVNTQFERVINQNDPSGVPKPGTITVVDAASFKVEREINGKPAGGRWNNPHNMWANFALDTVYNTNWFGKWLNKINRASGAIQSSIDVGEAPTHVISIPIVGPQLGTLTVPLSADDDMVKVRDTAGGLEVVDSDPTGDGKTHPHGHWLTCGEGDRVIVPNVFKGLGPAGSISILDTASGDVLKEFEHDAGDPLRAPILMPLAAGECHVNGVHKAYVANAVSGLVTVINVDAQIIIGSIPVTLTPDGLTGFDIFHTLQAPIQTPVSPDERFAAVAVFSFTSVPRRTTGEADHVAIIDTTTDQVVKFIPTPAGTHGVNWGAKLGGGYYAYVTNQHSNALTVIDPDPNGDGNASDAAAVGRLILSNRPSAGAGVTNGTGGQGVKPLPLTHDGWIQKTVALSGTGQLSPEVEGWIQKLTPEQKDPVGH